jgi:hypothetical protein
MAFLHYGDTKIELTDADVEKFTGSAVDFSKPGLRTMQLDSGAIHFVTGPGVPLLIDERGAIRGARNA